MKSEKSLLRHALNKAHNKTTILSEQSGGFYDLMTTALPLSPVGFMHKATISWTMHWDNLHWTLI